jgi:hypothetical protein
LFLHLHSFFKYFSRKMVRLPYSCMRIISMKLARKYVTVLHYPTQTAFRTALCVRVCRPHPSRYNHYQLSPKEFASFSVGPYAV